MKKDFLEKICKNDKIVSFEDIMALNLSEEEYHNLIKELKEKDIKIEHTKDEANESKETIEICDDALKQYMKEIRDIPLLTAAEEKELFEKYKATQDMNVRKRIIDSNLRLVVSVARHYLNVSKKTTISFLDIIQDGNEGLMKAVEKFDVDLGYKFSTYATWWIRQSISRAFIDNSRIIRIPPYMIEAYNKLKKYEIEESKKNFKIPTRAELAKKFELTEEQVEYIYSVCEANALSLDEKITEDQDVSRGDTIVSDEPTVEEIVEKKLTKEFMNKIINRVLEPREAFVVSMRYGLVNKYNKEDREKTLEEVGSVINVTRERVRQIEAKAFRKLRRVLKQYENTESLNKEKRERCY